MFKSRREIFENTRKLWPESVMISETQPYINNCVFTEPDTNDIYWEIEKTIDVNDDWRQVAIWSFSQAADKLGRRKYKKGERILRFRDVSFKSFNTKMLSNLFGGVNDEWKEEREIYLNLPFNHKRKSSRSLKAKSET